MSCWWKKLKMKCLGTMRKIVSEKERGLRHVVGLFYCRTGALHKIDGIMRQELNLEILNEHLQIPTTNLVWVQNGQKLTTKQTVKLVIKCLKNKSMLWCGSDLNLAKNLWADMKKLCTQSGLQT